MARKLKIKDIFSFYLENRVPQLENQRTAITCGEAVVSVLGDFRPDLITPKTCREYTAKRRADGVGDWTVRKEITLLSSMCNYAVKHKILDRADLPITEKPPQPAPKDRWLSESELCKLMRAAESLREGNRLSRIERFLWIAIMTGARKSAIINLTWQQIDFGTKVIHFNDPNENRNKHKKRKASVPISDELWPILQKAFDEREIGPYVLDNTGSIDYFFKQVVARAGLEKVTPHVLRHTAATHMARRGVDLWVIAGVLGNTMQVVEQNYAHHCPQHARAAVARIPSPNKDKEEINAWFA